MKTVLVRVPGGPEALDCVDLPAPVPGPGQISIRCHAFGVGQPDVLIRRGVYKWMPPLPANPGNDAAGVVEAVGPGVDTLRPGQKVLLSARDLPQRGGCYAEIVVAPADAVHVLADHVSFEQAVCLSNYQVAKALLDGTPDREVRTVLVVGAAGGVGSALVQLAKRAGHRVIGTVSSREKADFARAMGADDVVSYRTEDVIARVAELTHGSGVDLVFDHVGGATFTRYLEILAKWGTLVSYNAFTDPPDEDVLAALRRHMSHCLAVRCFSFHVYDDDRVGRRALMRSVITHLEAGEITPAIHTRLPLTEVRAAHVLLESGAALGKIVLTA